MRCCYLLLLLLLFLLLLYASVALQLGIVPQSSSSSSSSLPLPRPDKKRSMGKYGGLWWCDGEHWQVWQKVQKCKETRAKQLLLTVGSVGGCLKTRGKGRLLVEKWEREQLLAPRWWILWILRYCTKVPVTKEEAHVGTWLFSFSNITCHSRTTCLSLTHCTLTTIDSDHGTPPRRSQDGKWRLLYQQYLRKSQNMIIQPAALLLFPPYLLVFV